VRYRALRAACARAGCDRIATGHQRQDQAETVLHRLLRGAGARGLAGIPARRGSLLRPILERSREEVLDYLQHRGLDFREDPTNATPRYLRNRIRGSLLPVMEALAPGVERRLARSADLLRDDDHALERIAARVTPKGATGVARSALVGLPLAVSRRVVRRLWHAASGSRRDLGAEHVDAVVRLAGSASVGRVSLPHGLVAEVGRDLLELGVPELAVAVPSAMPISGPGAYALPGRAAVVEVAWDSAEPAPWPLELRTRRPGDRFRSEHGRAGRKLKRWLIDRKVPRARRSSLWVVADQKGRVLCVPELEPRARGTGALKVCFRETEARPCQGDE
jgi:tRNA(Ile)-lysidine synthase